MIIEYQSNFVFLNFNNYPNCLSQAEDTLSSIAVPYIICHLIEKNIIWAGYLNGRIYALYSLDLSNIPAFIGLNKRQLMQSYKICPVLVERNHDLHPVSDETIFAENDHVFVFSDYEALKGVGDLV